MSEGAVAVLPIGSITVILGGVHDLDIIGVGGRPPSSDGRGGSGVGDGFDVFIHVVEGNMP